MPTLTEEQRETLDQLSDEIFQRQPTVVFTGAGISTESGIPDYRGPNGVWKRVSPTLYRQFLADPAVRIRSWQRRQERYPVMASKQPNAGHRALGRLQEAGLVSTIITQNIDGLHQKAGSRADCVIELHGSVHQVRCLACGRLFPAEKFDAAFDGSEPRCSVCGGMVKEATISFGQPLVTEDLKRALQLARLAEVMLVVGSSLSVNPAAKVPLEAARAGAALAIINHEPTPLDRYAQFLVPASAGAALRYLAERLVP